MLLAAAGQSEGCTCVPCLSRNNFIRIGSGVFLERAREQEAVVVPRGCLTQARRGACV
jgi:hypothetical protein